MVGRRRLSVVSIGLLLYLLARQRHVKRLAAEVTPNLALPPQQILSWSRPASTVKIPSRPVVVHRVGTPDSFQPDDMPVGTKVVGPQSQSKLTEGLGVASVDAFIGSLPSLHDLLTFDWGVVEGIRHSAASGLDLSHWSNLRHYIDQHFFDVGQPDGFLVRLTGYVGEVKDAAVHAAAGQHIEWPDTPNQPGFDFTADGHPIQTKIGDLSTVNEHFQRYPDIPVDTHLDNAAHMADNPLVTGYADLDPSHIHDVTAHSLDSIDHDMHAGGPRVPYITVIRSGLREIGLLADGHTDLATAAKKVGLDAAGVGIGGTVGAKTGGAIGTVIAGPVGTVVGGVIGGIIGAIFGRGFTNEYKYADFKAAGEQYTQSVTVAQQAVKATEADAHARFSASVQEQQEAMRTYVVRVQSNLTKKLDECSRWHEARSVRFVRLFPEILAHLDASLATEQKSQLAAKKRSGFMRRVVWPAQCDVERSILRQAFVKRHARIRAARKNFVLLAQETPSQVEPSAAIKSIADFCKSNPFQSAEFDKVCAELKMVTEAGAKRQTDLRQMADNLCRTEYARRLSHVRRTVEDLSAEVSQAVSEQVAAVTAAKDAVVKEGWKVGIDAMAKKGQNEERQPPAAGESAVNEPGVSVPEAWTTCSRCGRAILVRTAKRNGGLCAICA